MICKKVKGKTDLNAARLEGVSGSLKGERKVYVWKKNVKMGHIFFAKRAVA